MLEAGGVPIHEPGLEPLIRRNVEAGRLRFTTDIDAGIAHGALQFIAVGTPPDEDGSADMQYVLAAARSIGSRMTDFRIVVDKSTVPVGTADRVRAAIADELAKRGATIPFAVVSNPEFLKEGAAVDDFMRPDRVVVGADDERAIAAMRAIYAPFMRSHERLLVMDVRSAELTKYAANAMLATRISFMNELANLADDLGADVELVRQGIGSDPRIGYHFLYPGIGYGGSCFPKDVKALLHTASEHGRPLRVLAAVEAANEAQKHRLVDKIVARLGRGPVRPHVCAVGARVQAEHRRHARGAVARDHRRACGARREDRRVRSGRDGRSEKSARRQRLGRVRTRSDGGAQRRRCSHRRDRVEGIPQPRFRRDPGAAAASRSCSTAGTSTSRRRSAPPASNTSRSAGADRRTHLVLTPMNMTQEETRFSTWAQRAAGHAHAHRRRRDARPLLVRRRRAHLAGSPGAGGQDRPQRGASRAAPPTSRATPPRSARR